MIRYITCIALLAAVVNGILGCETKSYGRQGTLTDYEQSTLTCREIDLESAKVQGWLAHVNKESAFSGRDVLAIFGDLGIGNSLERSSAIESANLRSEQLRALRVKKSCT